ncbi:glycosyltransferase [Microbispora sp. NPDC049125]|uniref:glycosyltransferase n=1 Tax=Microbispora sp. NPDC049125 TaxID=3154929 RepID=UPI003464F0BD
MLLITHGTNGDVLPFVRIGRELAERGHEVTVMTHAWFADRIAAAGLRHLPIDTAEGYDRHLDDARQFMLDPLKDPGGVLELYQRNGLFELLADEVRMIEAHYRPGETVVVARHTSGMAGLMAAERRGVPVALVSVTPHQYVSLPVVGEIFRNVLGRGYDEIFRSFGLRPVRDWTGYLMSVKTQLALWPEWFDAAGQQAPGHVVRCGFVLGDTAEGPVPEWSEPPVLITGGTGQVLHERFYDVAVAACRRIGRPALLVNRHPSFLPESLPDGVEWLPSAPFATVMPHVAAVLHHGGIGTLARALSSATPQVLLAHGVDRPDNAERLHRAGVAEWLPVTHWDEERLAGLLARALDDDGYRERMAPLAADAASENSVRVVAEHVEGLLGTDQIMTRPDPRERIARLTPEQRTRLAAMARARRDV